MHREAQQEEAADNVRPSAVLENERRQNNGGRLSVVSQTRQRRWGKRWWASVAGAKCRETRVPRAPLRPRPA